MGEDLGSLQSVIILSCWAGEHSKTGPGSSLCSFKSFLKVGASVSCGWSFFWGRGGGIQYSTFIK